MLCLPAQMMVWDLRSNVAFVAQFAESRPGCYPMANLPLKGLPEMCCPKHALSHAQENHATLGSTSTSSYPTQNLTELLQVWMQGNESPVVVMFSSLASLVSPLFDLACKLLLLVVYFLLTALEPSCHDRHVVTEREGERESHFQKQYVISINGGTVSLIRWTFCLWCLFQYIKACIFSKHTFETHDLVLMFTKQKRHEVQSVMIHFLATDMPTVQTSITRVSSKVDIWLTKSRAHTVHCRLSGVGTATLSSNRSVT